MKKAELEEFEKECGEFYEKCEKFAELFGWTPCSEWTRFEVQFEDFKRLIHFSQAHMLLNKKCPNCKKFSCAEDWADDNKCDWC